MIKPPKAAACEDIHWDQDCDDSDAGITVVDG
jgi:hypothetical protein